MRFEVRERYHRGSFVGFAVYDNSIDTDVAVFKVPTYSEQVAHYLALLSCHDHESGVV